MATLLKQSTAVNIKLGPFVDEADGVTPLTSLTISQADVRLAKNDGNWTQKSDSSAAAHEENGWYEVALNATDTNTLGCLIVHVHVAGALPVWREFMVVPANVYDSMVAGSDNLQVDTVQWGGTAVASANVLIDGAITAAKIGTGAITADKIASGALTAAKFAADAVAEIQSGLPTAADVKAQVVAALNTDTYAEPGQGAPPATASLVAKIGYLYKAWRNKHTQTSTTYSLYNDAGDTVDQKATVTDDGATFERSEVISGAS